MRRLSRLLGVLVWGLGGTLWAAAPIPLKQLDFVANYCLDCHDRETAKGELNLEIDSVDWSSAGVRRHWEDLFARVEGHKMPPPKKSQPTAAERSAFLAWLDGVLMAESPIGGTALRRLNHREYQRALQAIFPGTKIELPGGFPKDVAAHGFDTIAADLMTSPAHLEAYAESAIAAADRIFPPRQAPPKLATWQIPPRDMTISYSSSALVDGAMRLASAGPKTRNATWPTKFAAPVSGTYEVTLSLSARKPPADAIPTFGIGAHSPYERAGKDRQMHEIPVNSETPSKTTVEVTLFAGETLLFTYANAPLNYDKAAGAYKPFLEREFAANPLLAAAWAKLGKVPRGGNGWARVKKTMANDETLKPDSFSPGSAALEKLVKAVGSNPVASGETIVYKYFEEGPNIGIHHAEITGPHKLIEDDADRRQQKLQATFLGEEGRSLDDASIRAVLARHLYRTFRRPIEAAEVDPYLALVKQELAAGKPIDYGYHLAIRASLTSSHFLFRERGDELDDYELAGRLSFFLSGSQPDKQLLALAESGTLRQAGALRQAARSMLKDKARTLDFIRDFTGQWLDTNELDSLMPDPKLFPNYQDAHREVMKREVEMTFAEILAKNRPTIDFIDPDFVYTDASIGMHVYELPEFLPKKKGKGKDARIPKVSKVQRVSLERGGRRGGLLTMPAVMTATANGVDTQPVLRGVWALENLLGMPTPEPPKAVPALPPSTAGAASPKARLAAHMASPSCASCHQDIDPVGFALENLDPVGRWRTAYPSRNPEDKTIAVDATGNLPDGTPINSVVDLKKWLVEHPGHFTNCLARKLLEYATGRQLNYRERRIVADLCAANLAAGEGFQDLLLDLVESPVFQTR